MRKSSILAGSKRICSVETSGIFIDNLVGPIIHCSPDLTREIIKHTNNPGDDYYVKFY